MRCNEAHIKLVRWKSYSVLEYHFFLVLFHQLFRSLLFTSTLIILSQSNTPLTHYLLPTSVHSFLWDYFNKNGVLIIKVKFLVRHNTFYNISLFSLLCVMLLLSIWPCARAVVMHILNYAESTTLCSHCTWKRALTFEVTPSS